MTHHSRELLVEASLETGTGDTQDFDSDFPHNPGLQDISQHHASDEDVDFDGDDESVDKIIYRYGFMFLVLSLLTLTDGL